MKVYALAVLSATPSDNSDVPILAKATNLSSFPFFQRSTINEFLCFFMKTVAPRTPKGQRQSVEEDSYVAHVYNRGDEKGFASVIVTDTEYPARPAFTILNKVLDEFSNEVPDSTASQAESSGFNAKLKGYVERYEDPKSADTIMRVQQELDETKIILSKTIESVLQRGETLQTLVDKSNTLSASSKQFYRTAKKQNSCCVVM